jgi:hypothetical protein
MVPLAPPRSRTTYQCPGHLQSHGRGQRLASVVAELLLALIAREVVLLHEQHVGALTDLDARHLTAAELAKIVFDEVHGRTSSPSATA